ncbi:PadR family transcriptional regulator [Sinomonas sp. JGH33]|uniref:PadR family transcriptional regulator n=1 Tax=Sinomonas terricola TaxID=3110330 RepID=A0ABU5T7E2_9MICC|nr:PadR family transcriptional regulator [Sinomonas sp. JGH33]MEA5455595.1 PadR family transcriptional regulator [Sinomonas sp. JGH33]
MSLRNALLAMLTSQPMTGYDVYKNFQTSVGYVWHAPDSQIYPELRRMEQDGLISGETVPWGKRGTKKRYSITDAGVESFQEWLNTPPEYQRERDPVRLRAAYLEWAEPAASADFFRAHIEYHSARIADWEEMIRTLRDHSNPTLARRIEGKSDEEAERITAYKVFAYEGMIARAEVEIAWAEKGLELVERLGGQS